MLGRLWYGACILGIPTFGLKCLPIQPSRYMSGPTPGIRSLARALSFWDRAQAAVSNNLANVNTDSFKAIHLTAALAEDGVSPLAVEALDLSQGTLRETGRALDVAIDGEGFFVVGTEQGEMLIRGGSLEISATGVLVDTQGNPILGENGPIPVGSEDVQILEDGSVVVDGVRLDRLKTVKAPAEALDRTGSNRFVAAPNSATPVAAGDLRVKQGFLEDANTDAIGSMVDMIRVQRSYQSNMAALQAIDGVMASANRLGRLS